MAQVVAMMADGSRRVADSNRARLVLPALLFVAPMDMAATTLHRRGMGCQQRD